MRQRVVVIGGGGTGAALAHDLTLRGLAVTVLERGELTSGTTGRHHGLLHSGGRYAMTDRQSAVECVQENRILRRIAPGSFENGGGLFVAVTDDDADQRDEFVDACAESGIPTRLLSRSAALDAEPGLSPDVRLAVQVPDATMDAMRLPLRFFATAQRGGAVLRPFTEAVTFVSNGRSITAVVARDHMAGRNVAVPADLVINAAGPWSGRVAAMAGAEVPIRPSPGVLVAVTGRWCTHVVNRLHKPGDGDIVLPQRGLSVVGTSSWTVDDPDEVRVSSEHVRAILREGMRLVPAVGAASMRAAWAAVRPLIGATGSDASGRTLSRTFRCFDHAADGGADNLITITGGKATTLRSMAEATADIACAKLGVTTPCRTRDAVLLPHTAYYTSAEVGA
ncbi:MAG TPA: FAD-dependent oxidoreductase [Actinophytocola sp.]|uniref:FAD-dependent oxidoreductase n=1 Tax=Actinophytocola sp. TaxID=1872138 RepID=UPI002F95EFCF